MRQIQFQFTGNNIEITPTLRARTHIKFKKLARHPEITSIHVFFNVENQARQIAEAKIHLPGNEVFASAESENMYKTIDLLIDKLVRQLNKRKTKNIAGRNAIGMGRG